MTTVDSHMHVNFNRLSIIDIIKYLDKEKIDCCWLLSWEEINPGPWPYQHFTIEEVYEAYLKYPSRVVPFYAPDPHKKEAAEQLENWHQKGIRGCGEFKATLNWNSDDIEAVLQKVNRLKMPVVFHMEESQNRDIPYSNAIYDRILFDGLKTERKIYQVPRSVLGILVRNFNPLKNRTKSYIFPGYMLDFVSLGVALKKYPDIKFVAHGPMFWKHIFADSESGKLPKNSILGKGIIWRLLEDNQNLYADISGISGLNALTCDIQNAKLFLSLYEDKILYATDNLMKGQKDFLESLGLSKGTYKKIYGDNACKIMNI